MVNLRSNYQAVVVINRRRQRVTGEGLLNKQVLGGQMKIRRAVAGYTIQLLVMLNVLLVVGLAWSNYLWFSHSNTQSKQMKGGVVVEVDADGKATARSITEYNSDSKPMEQRAKAWEAVALIAGADSTAENLANLNFKKVKFMMTRELGMEFEKNIEPTAREIEEAKIKRVVESREEDVRPIKAEEMPQGRSLNGPGYHLLVSGKMSTYRAEGGDPLFAGRFAYYVNLVPSSEGRTVKNPSGLLLAALVPVQLTDTSKQLEETKGADFNALR
jgi:hypothetical protein